MAKFMVSLSLSKRSHSHSANHCWGWVAQNTTTYPIAQRTVHQRHNLVPLLLWTGTPHTSFFSCTMRMHNDVLHHSCSRTCLCTSHHTHGHPWWAVDLSSVLSLFLALFLSVCLSYTLLFSSHFYLYSVLNLFFHVDSAEANNHCHFAKRGVLLPGRIQSSHKLWAQAPWRLPLLGDCRNHLPGTVQWQRRGALVLVWRGTRRWDHRESALFTTVHSGARWTSAPKTNLSLSRRKFVDSSVLSCVSLKNGETRARTWFVQTKTKSRNGKRNHQDAPWKSKRPNSRWY